MLILSLGMLFKPGSDALTAIKKRFGDSVLLENGTLNRKQLRHIVFSKPDEKQWLNDLLHPLIRANIIAALSAAKSCYCILVAPLLLENKLHHIVDRVLVIDVSPECQIERTMARDNSSKDQVEAIISSQISRTDRIKLADDIIENESLTFNQLTEKVVHLHQTYLNLSKTLEK